MTFTKSTFGAVCACIGYTVGAVFPASAQGPVQTAVELVLAWTRQGTSNVVGQEIYAAPLKGSGDQVVATGTGWDLVRRGAPNAERLVTCGVDRTGPNSVKLVLHDQSGLYVATGSLGTLPRITFAAPERRPAAK